MSERRMFRDSAIQAWIAIAASRDMNCASQRVYFFGISYLSLGIDDLVWRQRQYAPDDGCWYKRSKPDLADKFSLDLLGLEGRSLR